MTDLGALLEQVEDTLEPLVVAANLAAWDANIEASDEHERRRVETALAVSDWLADPELFAAVVAERGSTGDEQAARQLELLHDAMLTEQVPPELRHRIVELEASVEARFSNHRAILRGAEVDDNTIKQVLRSSDDVAERREAWDASKTIGALVADDVRELARLRNLAAKGLGHRDWFALSVATSEMSEVRLFETLDECDRVTAGPFETWKGRLDAGLADRFGCGAGQLRPWHYDDPFFQEVPRGGGLDVEPYLDEQDVVELASRTFDGLGLETGAILAASDLYPRAGKCQHAFCVDVDRAGDVRVLANVVDDRYWADTMLHELGHGVYDLGCDPSLPWLLRDRHLTMTEGIALLMGSLTHDASWFREVVGVDAARAAELDAALRAGRAAELLVFTRWVLVMTNFERSLYADPESDLDTRWWELVARYQGITPPDDRRAPDWAAKIHIACVPVYYHTYLYGQMVAAQLRVMLEREAGGIVGRSAAGSLLRDRLFSRGQALRWDRLLEQATGEPLSARHLAGEIGA